MPKPCDVFVGDLERGIPRPVYPPVKRSALAERLGEMEINESFLTNAARGQCYYAAKCAFVTISVHKVGDGKNRVWRVA